MSTLDHKSRNPYFNKNAHTYQEGKDYADMFAVDLNDNNRINEALTFGPNSAMNTSKDQDTTRFTVEQ